MDGDDAGEVVEVDEKKTMVVAIDDSGHDEVMIYFSVVR